MAGPTTSGTVRHPARSTGRNLEGTLAMGKTPASQEITRLEALLPSLAQSSLDVCGQDGEIRWHTDLESPDGISKSDALFKPG